MTAAKMCQGCGVKPQAYHDRGLCYGCKPGTNGRPLPCRRCGRSGDYWSEGLCRLCHIFAPQPPDSCRDCLAWGVTRLRNWTCQACLGWRYREHTTGPCISCGRALNLNHAHACRLCWSQTVAQVRAGLPREVMRANRHGQQLSIAGIGDPRKGYRPHPRRYYPGSAGQSDGPFCPEPPAPGPHQLDLLAYHPIEGPARSLGFGSPPSSRLADQLDRLAVDHGRAYGWSGPQTTRARITLQVLQAKHGIRSTPIHARDVRDLTQHNLSIRMTLAVLAEHDLLVDDRMPRIHTWFPAQIADLPEPMISELQVWFRVLHDGSTTPPRSRPRSDGTIITRTQWGMPTLRIWAAAGHQSLREITRDHVVAALPTEGTPRATLGSALRSIFTTLKRHHVLFVNPTAHIQMGTFERRIPMPIDTARIQAALNSPNPAVAAITALIGIHGLRPRETCALNLTDIRDQRIHLPDRTILLAPAAKTRLDAYLNHRHQRWPATVNPHVLIHTRSAPTLEQVTAQWLTRQVGIQPQALRRDRILAEADAGGDERRICDFFGVTIETAAYYVATVNHPDLDNPPTGPRTDAKS